MGFAMTSQRRLERKAAVRLGMQIGFGSPVTGQSNWDPSHARSAILCMAAAFEAGFISGADFPNLTARAK